LFLEQAERSAGEFVLASAYPYLNDRIFTLTRR